jgi:hypothetical protein
MNRNLHVSVIAVASVALFPAALTAQSAKREWLKTITARSSVFAGEAAPDGLGNVYLVGKTEGSLFAPHAGGWDGFLAKFDGGGNTIWTRKFATAADEDARYVSVDPAGDVYVAGHTASDLDSATPREVVLHKYDPSGALLWTQQFPTPAVTEVSDISADSTGVYLTGTQGGGAFPTLTKFSAGGVRMWDKSLETAALTVTKGVSADGLGHLYVAGKRSYSPNGRDDDAVIARFDAEGNFFWTQTYSTPTYQDFTGVSADSLGNVYVSGRNIDDHESLDWDALVMKYDAQGKLLWNHRLASPVGRNSMDIALAAASDNAGNAFFIGRGADLFEPTGGVFVAKYDAAGDLLWALQNPSSFQVDYVVAGAADEAGRVFVSGYTAFPNSSVYGGFLAKYSSVPEPASTTTIAAVALVLACGRASKNARLAFGKALKSRRPGASLEF